MYNVKKITYPNGTTQIRYYKQPIFFKDETVEDLEIYSEEDVKNSLSPDDLLLIKDTRSFTSSLNRSKNQLYHYARSNKWDLFVTLTFSTDYDRTDYDLLCKKLSKWFNNIKSRYCPGLKYLVVPEEHKRVEDNGKHAYHFHALFADIDGLVLSPAFNKKTGMQLHIGGAAIFNLSQYKFGWSTASFVNDPYRATTYITKYVTKAFCIRQKNKRRFLSSNNLDEPKVELAYLPPEDFMEFMSDYEIDYFNSKECKVGDFSQSVTYYEVHPTNSQNN